MVPTVLESRHSSGCEIRNTARRLHSFVDLKRSYSQPRWSDISVYCLHFRSALWNNQNKCIFIAANNLSVLKTQVDVALQGLSHLGAIVAWRRLPRGILLTAWDSVVIVRLVRKLHPVCRSSSSAHFFFSIVSILWWSFTMKGKTYDLKASCFSLLMHAHICSCARPHMPILCKWRYPVLETQFTWIFPW